MNDRPMVAVATDALVIEPLAAGSRLRRDRLPRPTLAQGPSLRPMRPIPRSGRVVGTRVALGLLETK